MINEERVKQAYKIAMYEQTEEKRYRHTGKYYREDYIGKELITSIFSGTIAYVFMAALWIMSDWSKFLEGLTNAKIANTVAVMIVIYIVYMMVYLFSTYVIYSKRYKNGRKKLEGYKKDLKTLNQMYEREEKLKL